MIGRSSATAGATYFLNPGTSRENVETVAQSKNIDPYFNLSLGNAIYSDSVTTVQAPAVASYILIKV